MRVHAVHGKYMYSLTHAHVHVHVNVHVHTLILPGSGGCTIVITSTAIIIIIITTTTTTTTNHRSSFSEFVTVRTPVSAATVLSGITAPRAFDLREQILGNSRSPSGQIR